MNKKKTIKAVISAMSALIIALMSVVVMMPASAASTQTVNEGIYLFKNVSSKKMMNTYAGVDKNGTKVTLWQYDGTTDQRYRVQYFAKSGQYKLFAYSSSSGTNRVVDVYRGNAALKSGQKIDIWSPNDDAAQLLLIEQQNDGSYIFRMANNTSLAIGINGTSNGSQLLLVTYNSADKTQRWKFCDTKGAEVNPKFEENVAAASYVWPTTSYRITVLDCYYGKKGQPHPTRGEGSVLGSVDIAVSAKQPVYATASGIVQSVVVSNATSGWGTNVTIKHDDGTYSFYAHLTSSTVKKNDVVKAGQQIAKSGSTGNSTGPHLHFEIWDSNKNTAYTFDYLKDKYLSKLILDTDIVSGGGDRAATIQWVKENMKVKNGVYVTK